MEIFLTFASEQRVTWLTNAIFQAAVDRSPRSVAAGDVDDVVAASLDPHHAWFLFTLRDLIAARAGKPVAAGADHRKGKGHLGRAPSLRAQKRNISFWPVL